MVAVLWVVVSALRLMVVLLRSRVLLASFAVCVAAASEPAELVEGDGP